MLSDLLCRDMQIHPRFACALSFIRAQMTPSIFKSNDDDGEGYLFNHVAGVWYKIVHGTLYNLYAMLHGKVEGRWTTRGISERNKGLQRLHSLVCLLS